jgi:DNA-binding MarR family transcriptional regulator
VPQEQLNQLADEILQLTMLSAALRSRGRKQDAEELSEVEFMALDILHRHGTLSVGEIQREIGILPAQMSRLIRALEARSLGPLVECKINEQDRRKIDVTLSKRGCKEHEDYRAARRTTTIDFLKHMTQEDRATFMRLIRSFRERITKSIQQQ